MDNKLMFLVFVFFLVFGTFATAVFFDQSPALRARASNRCTPALSKSFATSFPKDVQAGEKCEVNVFVRCDNELAVTGATVRLSVSNGSVDNAEALTDESGRAVFTVTPQGLARISATINGNLQLPETITCNSQ
jgi:hypothetical protein